ERTPFRPGQGSPGTRGAAPSPRPATNLTAGRPGQTGRGVRPERLPPGSPDTPVADNERSRRAERPRRTDTDTRTVDSGQVDRATLREEQLGIGPRPTPLQVREREAAQRPQRVPAPEPRGRRPPTIASRQTRDGAKTDKADRNTQRVTAGANAR